MESESRVKKLRWLVILLIPMVMFPFQNCMKMSSKGFNNNSYSSFSGGSGNPYIPPPNSGSGGGSTPPPTSAKNCTFNNQSVASGQGIWTYSVQTAEYGKNCQNNYGLYQTCQDGVFTSAGNSTNYIYSSCQETTNSNYTFKLVPLNQRTTVSPKAMSILSSYSFHYVPDLINVAEATEFKIYKNGQLYFEHSNGSGRPPANDGTDNHPYRYGLIFSEGNYSMTFTNKSGYVQQFGFLSVNKAAEKDPNPAHDPRYSLYGFLSDAISAKKLNSNESVSFNTYINPRDLNFGLKNPGDPDSGYVKLVKINFVKDNKIVSDAVVFNVGGRPRSYYQHLGVNKTVEATYYLENNSSINARVRFEIGDCGSLTKDSFTVLESNGLSVSEDLVSISQGCVAYDNIRTDDGGHSYYPVEKANVEFKMIDNSQ